MTASRATVPLPGRLSQLRIVSGFPPWARRASSPLTIASIVGFGLSRGEPPPGIVRDRIATSGRAACWADAAGAPGTRPGVANPPADTGPGGAPATSLQRLT